MPTAGFGKRERRFLREEPLKGWKAKGVHPFDWWASRPEFTKGCLISSRLLLQNHGLLCVSGKSAPIVIPDASANKSGSTNLQNEEPNKYDASVASPLSLDMKETQPH